MSKEIDNTILGRRRAIVESIDDPEKLLRAQIRLVHDWRSLQLDDLPWAEYSLPIGARPGEGEFIPVKKGDLVWVEFEAGDSRYPVIVGAVHYAPEGRLNLPEQADAAKQYQHKRTEQQPPAANTQYGVTYALDRLGFLTEEVQNTLRITHKKTGTAIEVNESGEVIVHCENNYYQSVAKNKLIEVSGSVTDNIGNGLTINVTGDSKITSTGNIDAQAKGNANIQAGGNVDVKAKGSANIKATGAVAVDGATIGLNKGAGVVTVECICSLTGASHPDGSATVMAGK